MSSFHNKYKYQLIYPIVGTRVYQTTSFKKGAVKCYNELKSLNNINSSYFTILNLDTYETYKFKINTKLNPELNPKLNLDTNIQDTLNDLNIRVKKIEDTIFNSKNSNLVFDEINKIHKVDKIDKLDKMDKVDKINKIDKIDEIIKTDNFANVLTKNYKIKDEQNIDFNDDNCIIM